MQPLSRILAALSLAALGATVTGCYSKATGYQGKFTFGYASGIEFENFVKPVAPGAKLDVVAFANGTEDELVITSATSSRPGVLAVEKLNERSLVLKAGAPGVADIEITARDANGNTLVDKMFFHVAKPTVHALEHGCTDNRDAIYVKGERAFVYHHLATSDGRPVIGYAYAPVRVEPEARSSSSRSRREPPPTRSARAPRARESPFARRWTTRRCRSAWWTAAS